MYIKSISLGMILFSTSVFAEDYLECINNCMNSYYECINKGKGTKSACWIAYEKCTLDNQCSSKDF